MSEREDMAQAYDDALVSLTRTFCDCTRDAGIEARSVASIITAATLTLAAKAAVDHTSREQFLIAARVAWDLRAASDRGTVQ